MVNCTTCKKAFKSRVGKGKNTRCERCAELWRELQLREDDEGRKERNREMDLMERELEIKNQQLEMERQKVTIKESLPSGRIVELTCFYDDKMQEKVRSLLKGAHLALPTTSAEEKTPVTDKYGKDLSYRSRSSTIEKDELSSYRKVHFEPEINSSPNYKEFNATETKSLSDCRKPRKLPSVDGLRSRLISRHKLEDEGSSFGSGGSVD